MVNLKRFLPSSGKQTLTYGMGNRGPNSSVAEYHVGKGWESEGIKYKKNTMRKEDFAESQMRTKPNQTRFKFPGSNGGGHGGWAAPCLMDGEMPHVAGRKQEVGRCWGSMIMEGSFTVSELSQLSSRT